MNANIANFSEYKKKFDPQVVYVGDTVEWQDYDGQTYEGKVTSIEYCPLESHAISQKVESLPLWEKDEYVVYLGEGFLVIGDAIVRKVIKRASDKQKPQNLPGRRYAH